MEIHKYIAELLSEHDCVIIPGLGGFVGSYLPAQIHSVYHTFQPPSKKILFNINLRQNDGLLANHISQAENISFSEASEMIRHFSEDTIRSLKTKKYLILQNVGKFYMGKEGNIQFDQDLRSNLLAESFGLSPFFSSPIARDSHQERTDKRVKTKIDTKEFVQQAIPKPLKWAAILALPVAGAILLSLAGYDSIKSGSWNTADILSSLSPFSKAETKKAPDEKPPFYMIEEELPAQSDQQGERDLSAGPFREKTEPAETPETSDTKTTIQPQAIQEQPGSSPTIPLLRDLPQSTDADQGSYAVIIGAFSVESNAHKLVRQLSQKGVKATIYDRSSGGLSRVAAGVFTTQTEALRMMQKMKADGFPGAWILEK